MEIVTGALPRVITKLGVLLNDEYRLRMKTEEDIIFLQVELKRSMEDVLENISNTPPDQLSIPDKNWARELRELSYDIEDSIDSFMRVEDIKKSAKPQGIKKFIQQITGLFQLSRRRRMAIEIVDINARVAELHRRRQRYHVAHGVHKPTTPTMDPRLFSQHTETKELIGIDETRDELVNNLMEENGVSLQQGKIVSIVGLGGLGKTTLANAVYEKISAQFDCHAFVSVSQTPDLNKLFKDILYQLDRNKYDDSINETFLDEQQLINELREVLQHKRYLLIIDDIWDISVWQIIRSALPDNDVGYIIITTTRNFRVAEEVGGVYKLKPLSQSNSQKLLYKRIFGNENKDNIEDIEKCLDEELAKVSERILEKCGGVPLAIVTIASLLASKARNKIDWYDVCKSIGTGLCDSTDMVNMRNILSLSYYEMPFHLRTCLLYLSMFPEDSKIEKDRLIWMWIAEGFIQCEEEKSLFSIGESYFNDLINRSMIQPIYERYTGLIYACRVHDLVHDLICFLSSEENLVTVLNGVYDPSPSKKIRRLSLQYGQENDKHRHTLSLEHVRSAVVFPSAFYVMPVLTRFRVLRVLNLQDCDLSRGYSLEYLGKLFHLRYLGLFATYIAQLPKEIRNLKFLQTLDVRGNNMFNLPSEVVQLKTLMCLYIDEFTRVPNGIGSLTNLEVLSTLDITVSIDIIEELGQLTKLRVLHILLFVGWSEKLVECLSKLQNIQYLYIKVSGDHQWDFGYGLDAWVAPRHLYRLDIEWPCWFSTLPSWMNPSYLLDLVYLSIAVRDLGQVNLETLGRLPALRLLKLSVDPKNLGTLGGFIIGAGLFPCLVFFQFGGSIGPIVFQQGAMPRLEILNFEFHVQAARQITWNCDGPELGLGTLSSLQDVKIYLHSRGASREEVKELVAALRHAVEIHPNLPNHQIYG